jgi:hypothetical protein
MTKVGGFMKAWEIIADNLSKAGWSWGCVSTINSKGQTIWIVDAHRGGQSLYGTGIRDSRLRRIASTSWRDLPETPGIWKHAFHQF